MVRDDVGVKTTPGHLYDRLHRAKLLAGSKAPHSVLLLSGAITVEIDGRPAVEGQMVIVSNTRNYGGLFTLADRARCDSGHLDVCVVRDGSIGGLLSAGISGLTGGLSRREDVAYLTGQRIRVRADAAIPYEVDGDFAGDTPIDIELRPAHVPIVVPAN